jgi:hypothetical protein
MSDNKQVMTIDPKQAARESKIDPARVDEFLTVIDRAYRAKKPTKEDIRAIHKFLQEYPEFCQIVFNTAQATRKRIVQDWVVDEIAQAAIEGQIDYMRKEMGYPAAPIMEQMLIDSIVTAWLRLQYVDYAVAAKMGREFNMRQMEYWHKYLAAAQRNYLAACESLAKIRKMKLPNIQLNIGDKQINVAGDLKPDTTEIINV